MQSLKNIVINGAVTLALLFGMIASASAEEKTLANIEARIEANKSEAQKERDRAWEIKKAELKAMSDEISKIRQAQMAIQLSKPMPTIGMHKSKIRNDTSWGYPDKINTTIDANGSHEQWVYRTYFGSRYLYFVNDKLTSIQY